eukprot:711489-Amphidinium_carterae.2
MLVQLVCPRIRSLLHGGAIESNNVKRDLASLFLEDKRVGRILPLILRRLCLAYAREDCSDDLRKQMEALVVPFVLVLMLVMDSSIHDKEIGKPLGRAVRIFCCASSHPLLAGFEEGTGGPAERSSLLEVVNKSMELAWIEQLCLIAEGKPWAHNASHTKELANQPLGGPVAQA